jgi:hypothetical protein
LNPDFFVIGERVNEFWADTDNPNLINNTFQDFLNLCNWSTEEIHGIHPDTNTIIEFDLCDVLSLDQWGMVENITKSHCDIISFVSHPHDRGTPKGSMYSSPESIPASYYHQIRNHTQLPIAFTGVSWPSGSLNNSKFNFTGSDRDQSDFLDMFIDIVNNMTDVKLVIWDGLHDLIPPENSSFLYQMTGLKYHNGTKKAAYNGWKLFFELGLDPSTDDWAEHPDHTLGYDPAFSLWMGLLAWIGTVALISITIAGINKLVLRERSRCKCSGEPGCDCDI